MNRSPDDSFRHDQPDQCGILITNLGTPDQPTASAVRRYLGEFLMDTRVIEIPRWLWWMILHGIILRVRPAKVAKAYAGIWTDQGSPLLAIGRRQQAALQAQLTTAGYKNAIVELGMRYGNPSLGSALRALRDAGARRILLLPLYPQYSAATSASTFDALARELAQWRWVPEIRTVGHYHDSPAYIRALSATISRAWEGRTPSRKLLFSFHGMPRSTLLAGDPYHCECHKTARLVAEHLGLAPERWAVSFQSRFGKAEWLKPYTSELLKDWASSGVESVDVICPGFSADCLETLEEIEVENRGYFRAQGGTDFRYIPALNDQPVHIEALLSIVCAATHGWPMNDSESSPEDSPAATKDRASAHGAAR